MKSLVTTLRLAAACLMFATAICAQQDQPLVVRGEIVYTMAGAPVKDGVVIVRGGKIAEVGPTSAVKIPANARTLVAKVVTPGLIDAHTVVGLAGYTNQPNDQDQVERSSPIQPELRAIDAYNARDRLVEWLRGYGVTTMHTGHGPNALVSGQTMIVKTRVGGAGADDGVLVPTAMVAATIGSAALGEGTRAPGTRSKMVAMLRAELLRAQDYAAKQALAEDKRPARDLHLEAWARVIKREIPLLVTAHRAVDIASALRLAREFNFRLVLDGASEAYLLIDQIKAANVPVIVHPTMFRNTGEAENLSMETAARLRRAGVTVALQSSYESYVPKTRVVLFEAALAAANGLSFEEALATVTIDAARILGVEARVGSLAAGKDADLALYDGDPFEYTSHAVGVVIDGQVVSESVR